MNGKVAVLTFRKDLSCWDGDTLGSTATTVMTKSIRSHVNKESYGINTYFAHLDCKIILQQDFVPLVGVYLANSKQPLDSH